MKKRIIRNPDIQSDIAAVVLAGGIGSRLSPLDLNTPKALITLDGKPLLQRIVEWMKPPINSVYIAVGLQIESIRNEIITDPNITFTEDPDIGTGKALIKAASHINAEHILVCNADTINELNLNKMIQEHLQRGKGATIALTRWEDAQNAGAFCVTLDGQVMRSVEDLQPRGHTFQSFSWKGASTGVLIIPTAALRDNRLQNALSLEKEIIPHLIETEGLFAFDNGTGFCLDIGTPERLRFMRDNEKKLARLQR